MLSLSSVYFGIFDAAVDDVEEPLRFLKGVKEGFGDDLSFRCFQNEMDLVFRRLLELRYDDGVNRTAFVNSNIRNASSDSSCGSQMNGVKPLLGHQRELERKVEVAEFGTGDEAIDVFSAEKISKDDNVDVAVSVLCREKRKTRWRWRTRLSFVLLMDLLVCSLFFGVWLFVCKGIRVSC